MHDKTAERESQAVTYTCPMHPEIVRSATIRGRDGAAPPMTLCIDGKVCEFVSGTTRAFRLNDDATDCGTHRDVPGDAP